MEWMILPLKRYADFSGRSRRMEFWMWVLFTIIVGFVLGLIDGVVGLKFGAPPADPNALRAGGFGMIFVRSMGILGLIWNLATLIPSLAVSVRRLHDRDKSGWWLLLPVLPYGIGMVLVLAGVGGASPALAAIGGILFFVGLICAIVLLVWYCLPGTPGPNRFGADPLDPNAANLGEVFS